MTLGIAALVAYVLSRGWIMCEAYAKKQSSTHLVLEFIYSILMIYLLSKGSYIFLAIVHFYFFIMIMLSLFAIIFLTPPESDNFFNKSQINFWLETTTRLVFHIVVWVLCVNY